MADDPHSQGRLTRVSSFVFLHTEHAIYAAWACCWRSPR